MTSAPGVWGKLRATASACMRYVFDRLGNLAFIILVMLFLAVAAIRTFDIDTSYSTPIYTTFLAALIAVMTKNISYLYKKLSNELGEQQREIQLLGKIIRTGARLLSLEEAIKDMDGKLRVESGDEVEIEHLGIHMEHAWHHLEPVLLRLAEAASVRPVRFKLVMLRREKGRRRRFPREIERWLGIARDNGVTLQRRLEQMNRDYPGFRGDIRFYSEIPVIHGIRLKKPSAAAYVAISRWTGAADDFDAGTKKYHRADTRGVAAERDLMAVLDAYFHHHWKEGRVVAPAVTPTEGPTAV